MPIALAEAEEDVGGVRAVFQGVACTHDVACGPARVGQLADLATQLLLRASARP